MTEQTNAPEPQEDTFDLDATIIGQCHVIRTPDGQTLIACPLDLMGELAKAKASPPLQGAEETQHFERR